MRPGYSGQVEYKFYVDKFVKGCTDADFIDPKTIFNEDEEFKNIFLFIAGRKISKFCQLIPEAHQVYRYYKSHYRQA